MSQVLTKGQNAPLPGGPVTVTVDTGNQPSDLSALLVTPAGVVRSDADFVFFNQPNGPGVACLQLPDGRWQITVDPTAVPAAIDQVRVVVALEGDGARFAGLPAPTARVTDVGGTVLATYEVTGLSTESIVIAMEIYRRNADWKVRAVGQGYAGGLAALITDHGVTVDDAPAPAEQMPVAPAHVSPPQPPQVAVPPGYPPPGAAYPPPSSTFPPPASGFQAPAPGFPAPASGFPAPASGFPPPNAGFPPPNAGFPPPNAGFPPPNAGFPPPGGQPAPGSAYPPPGNTAGGGTSGAPNLVKGRPVSLSKGQSVNLRKEDGSVLTRVRMGLGWDAATGFGRSSQIDLDASAILFDGTKDVEKVAFTHLKSRDGTVRHSGDNLTGRGEGDDETITVELDRLPANISTVMFVVTSYLGQKFDKVANAHCRLVDDITGEELVRYTLGDKTPHRGMVMAKLFRTPGGWQMQAIGEGINARTPGKAASLSVPFI